MTALEKYFFTPLYRPTSAFEVVRWWESRRIMFNLCVGAAGVLSLAAITVFAGAPDAMIVAGVVGYAFMANVCFTLGWVADLALRRWIGERAPAAGPVLFRYGFVFAVGLTLLPIPIVLAGWVLQNL